MCPACIASTAVILAGAGSTGGILALCIGKFRRFFDVSRLGPFQKTKEMKSLTPLRGGRRERTNKQIERNLYELTRL